MIFLWPGFIELKLMRAASQPLFTAFCIHHYHHTCVCLWSILMGQYLVCNKHKWNINMKIFVKCCICWWIIYFFIHLLKSHVSSQSSKVTSTNKTNSFKTRQIWGIWKLRPAYSPETPNSGQKRWCFVPCDLEIWWMTLENNRAPLLCCFKLCATFHNHQWIQTGVAVQKRPISVKFDDF